MNVGGEGQRGGLLARDYADDNVLENLAIHESSAMCLGNKPLTLKLW